MNEYIKVKRLEVESFSLVDAKGNERCVIETSGSVQSKTSAVYLNLYDNLQNPRISLSVDQDGPTMVLFDALATNSITLKVGIAGNVVLIKDSTGNIRCQISMALSEDKMKVSLWNKDGVAVLES